MLESTCFEAGKEVRRAVYIMPRTVSKILEIHSRMQRVPNFLPKLNTLGIFLDENNTFFEIDDVGVIALLPLPEGLGAHCHITFWDKRLRGRESLCRALAEMVVELRKESLFTAIPEESRTVLAFARRVGFRDWQAKEGIVTLRFEI